MNKPPEPQSKAFPPPPWRLQGEAWLRLQTLPTRELSLPPPLRPVVLPGGRTPGGLVLARYGAGSTLLYHELMLFCLVQRRGLPGAWLPWLYVDDAASVAGGRSLWGLPKRLARFDWRQDEQATRVSVTTEDTELCRLCLSPGRGPALPLPLLAPLWSERRGKARWLLPRGGGRGLRVRWDMTLAPGSPLRDFGLYGGRALHLRGLRMHMPA